MTIEKFTGGKDLPPLSDQAVLNFLRQSPDFFLRHPSALSELSLPHESGQAVSLIERQIDILRDRNVTMPRRMNVLLQAARSNDEIFAKWSTTVSYVCACSNAAPQRRSPAVAAPAPPLLQADT